MAWFLVLLLHIGGAVPQETDQLAHSRRVPLDAESVMIVGVDSQKLAVIRVVDVKTAAVRAETRGTSPRWYPDQRYVILRRDGSWYAFHVPGGRLEGPLSQIEVTARSISYGNPLERRGTLEVALKDPIVRASSAVQAAALERLRLELATRLPEGRDEASLRERRTREREIEFLLKLSALSRDAGVAPLIASADIDAARGGLLDLGRSGIPAVLNAWRNPPKDVSGSYKPRLLETLHQLTTIYRDAATPEVREIVRGVLQSPSNVRAVLAAIRFADDLDDDQGLQLVRQYATDNIFAAERIPSLDDAQLVKATAADIVSRRIVIR